MNIAISYPSIILLILTIDSVICSDKFCDQKAFKAVFNLRDKIYFVNENNKYWMYSKTLGMSGNPPFNLENRFKDIQMFDIQSALTVDSIPGACDESREYEKCLFNRFMLDQTFIFYKKYNKDNAKQIYSMVSYNKESDSYHLDKSVGGFGYGLRANHTLRRSSFNRYVVPKENRLITIVATLYKREDNEIVLFGLKENHNLLLWKKSLNKEWDEAPDVQELDWMLTSAFKRDDQYYAIDYDLDVFELSADMKTKVKVKGQKLQQFFGQCLNG